MQFRKNENLFQKLDNGNWVTIYVFDKPIRNFWHVVAPDGETILLCTKLKNTSTSSNVYRFDLAGNFKWQIEAPPSFEIPGVGKFPVAMDGCDVEDGKLIAGATSGWDYEIDWDTGKIVGTHGSSK